MTVHVVDPWRETKLKCGIGHVVSGRVRVVQRLERDPEGFEVWREPTHEYDPDTCVVCGLKIFGQAPTSV